MYRSNQQFVSAQRVSDRDNYCSASSPRILYRYENPSNRQFAVAQSTRGRCCSDLDQCCATPSSYRNLSMRYNTAECTVGNSSRYPINNFGYQSACSANSCSLNDCQSGCCGNSCSLNDCQSGCCGDSCSLNNCQSGCCGDTCGLTYRQSGPRMW